MYTNKRGHHLKHEHHINLESLTVREFCEATDAQGIKPTVLLAEYVLRRESTGSEA